MGIFSRGPKREYKSFAQIKAEREARAAESAEERHARGETTLIERLADVAEHGDEYAHLRKVAADATRPESERQAARDELVAAIGEERADRLIGAETRLKRRGWTR
jgi:acetyl-CoA carboxylase carboxyltransferase component